VRIGISIAVAWHFLKHPIERADVTTKLRRSQPEGLMARRIASINDLQSMESERKFHWTRDNNGRRPDDHPALSDLGL
jgi:nuclear transport factor 2 (NTF2) superfamily protein